MGRAPRWLDYGEKSGVGLPTFSGEDQGGLRSPAQEAGQTRGRAARGGLAVRGTPGRIRQAVPTGTIRRAAATRRVGSRAGESTRGPAPGRAARCVGSEAARRDAVRAQADSARGWDQQVDDGQKEGLTTAEREELSKLRRDNRRLLMEREILKKAAAFFASEEIGRTR